MAVEDTGVTNWGQSPHLGTPSYPVLSCTGKTLMDLLSFPGGTQGNHVPCQFSLPFSSPTSLICPQESWDTAPSMQPNALRRSLVMLFVSSLP